MSNSILTQDAINSLYRHEESRRRSADCAYDRFVHNKELRTIIDELSDDLDE